MRGLGALVAAAGFGDQPVAVATCDAAGFVATHQQGRWADGAPVEAGDRFYGASLSKQLTGAAIALLVQDQALDVDAPLGRYLPALPEWRDRVSLRQLLHHAAGLPEARAFEPDGVAHWTNGRAFNHLAQLMHLPFAPGAHQHYSNLGYICLGAVVEAVSGQPLSAFLEARIIRTLGLEGMSIWDGGSDLSYRQAGHFGPSRPLSTGDGGLWTTAGSFAHWLDSQNRDVLGIGEMLERPLLLSDGGVTDYGWGIGLRTYRGRPLFIHGGSWTGASAKAVRCPALGLSVVGLCAESNSTALHPLVDKIFAALADGSS